MPESLPSRTALVVDDEIAILELARSALEKLGFEVLAASNAQAALEMVREWEGPLELMLIDVVMPDVNGPELAERVRELHPEAKLIFTSGYGLGASVALRQRETEALYLTKPFGIEQLGRHVERALAEA